MAADGGMAGRFTGDLARRGAACGCGCCGSWLRLVDTDRSGKKFVTFYLIIRGNRKMRIVVVGEGYFEVFEVVSLILYQTSKFF